MSKADWDAFGKAVADGAVLILNPKTYSDMMAAAEDAEHRQFLSSHSRTSEHIPPDQAIAVFTHQETIELSPKPEKPAS